MRETLDKLISWTGLILAVVLLCAGGLLTWAYFFIGNEVETQFGNQDIVMPSGGAIDALEDQADRDALQKFAEDGNNPLDNGPEARAYADHYIFAHMMASSGGKTYSEVSGEQMTACKADATSDDCTTLTGLKNTLFQGNTLRGLLLYGYAFATIGTIAGIAAIGAFALGIVVLVLALLGFGHAKRVHSA